jgi:hypothetical protein
VLLRDETGLYLYQKRLERGRFARLWHYTGGLWTGLVQFLGDAKIPLDTNGVARALRCTAVGRKTHYGSQSERETRVAALPDSSIESANVAGVEPRPYLGGAARRAIRNPESVALARDLKQPESRSSLPAVPSAESMDEDLPLIGLWQPVKPITTRKGPSQAPQGFPPVSKHEPSGATEPAREARGDSSRTPKLAGSGELGSTCGW